MDYTLPQDALGQTTEPRHPQDYDMPRSEASQLPHYAMALSEGMPSTSGVGSGAKSAVEYPINAVMSIPFFLQVPARTMTTIHPEATLSQVCRWPRPALFCLWTIISDAMSNQPSCSLRRRPTRL
jgi:hypothetical protein